jgi:hypothetical protein
MCLANIPPKAVFQPALQSIDRLATGSGVESEDSGAATTLLRFGTFLTLGIKT